MLLTFTLEYGKIKKHGWNSSSQLIYKECPMAKKPCFIGKKRIFLAMDDEARDAFRRRIFGTVWVPAMLATAARLVKNGEIPTVPINSKTVGVACDINLLLDLVETTRARKHQRKPLDPEATRQMVLAQTQATA